MASNFTTDGTTDGTTDCGGIRHDLTATVTIRVVDPGASPRRSDPAPFATADPTVPPPPTPGPSGPIRAAVICGLGPDSCDTAIALVRREHPTEVDAAIEIVVADTCPPPAICDRKFPFDSLVVLVPAPPDSGSPTVYETVGLGNAADQLLPFSGPLPAHIAALIPDPAHQAVDDGTFRLELSTEPKIYGPDDPIVPAATLTSIGPARQVRFGHSDPAVVFSIEEIGGDGKQMSGGANDSCSFTILNQEVPSPIPFVKSGQIGLGFDEAWFRDPVLRLPPGTWRIRVRLEAMVPECSAGAEMHELTAENVILVR